MNNTIQDFLMSKLEDGGFVDRHFHHFNNLKECAQSLDKFLSSGGRLMVTLAGAMSTAEIGVHSTSNTVRKGPCCYAGANLEEDVFNLIAHSHYKKVPNWRNLSKDDDRLHSQGFNKFRSCIPEDDNSLIDITNGKTT